MSHEGNLYTKFIYLCRNRILPKLKNTLFHWSKICFSLIVDGTGLNDGEGVERLWFYLRKFSSITKEMIVTNRNHLLVDALTVYKAVLGMFIYWCKYCMYISEVMCTIVSECHIHNNLCYMFCLKVPWFWNKSIYDLKKNLSDDWI